VVLDYILQEWLSFLAKKHIVKVIAAMPYYTNGKFTQNDKEGLFSTEIVKCGNL
jgi:hypothetical protein